MSDVFYKTGRYAKGFSLAEVLAALTIGAMILVAVLGIYNRAQRCAAGVMDRLDSSQLGTEVLQRIAEDLDRIVSPGTDTKITVDNRLNNLYQSARLEILKTIYDAKNKKQTFEKIVWQTSFDYDSDADGLVLYRSYSGMVAEDKVLDEPRADWEKGFSFVPICSGLTVFKIQIPKKVGKETEAEMEEEFLDEWNSDTLPTGLVVTISFAEAFKTVAGILDVADEEKITRTTAVDKTRKARFKFIEPKESFDQYEQEEEKDQYQEQDRGQS